MIVRTVSAQEPDSPRNIHAVVECYPPKPEIYIAIGFPGSGKAVNVTCPSVVELRRWLLGTSTGLRKIIGQEATDAFREKMLVVVAEIEATTTSSSPDPQP